MLGLGAPQKGIIGGVLATFVGLGVYNYTQRPTTQTVQGIDNLTLVAIAGAIAFVVWSRN